MEHSKLVPLTFFKKEKYSIYEIAGLVLNFYKKLAQGDSNYNRIGINSEIPRLYEFIEVNGEGSQKLLALEILNQKIDDIIKEDKVDNPDIDFIFDKAFISFSLESKIGSNTFAVLTFCFTISQYLNASTGSIVINKLCFNTYEKAKYFIDSCVNSFNVNYSTIKISDRPLNKVARAFKAPLGYITYFSNDYEVDIPNDLEGVEYEHTEKGKYLILTKDNLTFEDENSLKHYSDKLIKLMKGIAERVPEYSK